jgi:hypothetical protein
VDSTGIGDPVLEELQVDHGNFTGYMFSLVSKQKLMEGLAVSIQSHEIGYPEGPIRQELESFEYVVTPSGRTTYAAAQGHPDDCVCALALARELWAETQPGANLTSWMKNETNKEKVLAQTAETPPKLNPFPSRISISSSDLDNELTELYKSTLEELSAPGAKLCRQCGLPILGPSRISDGEFVWHMDCVIGGVTRELEKRISHNVW